MTTPERSISARSRKKWRGAFLLPAIAILALQPPASIGAEPRTLYWRALEVRAHLDSEGRLHVRERHVIVFDGAWNGGERIFRVEPGQRLRFEGLSRIDAGGHAHRLRAGDLGEIDQYRWVDDRTLRWRSRLPSDPPFRSTEQVFEIDYVLSNILASHGDTFLLDHDFAFPGRQWPILRFTLDFDWDAAWQSQQAFSGRLERGNMQPGTGAVLALPFRYAGAGVPAGVRLPAVPALRGFLILALLAFIAWRGVAFYRHEKRVGRYVPLPPLAQIDDAWLDREVFRLRPEVVGAAWDKTTSAPEVAAVLARLTAEGKLASEVRRVGAWFWRRDVLHLKLLHERATLKGYERKLVDALFFDGDTTDTDRIRARYRKVGFHPVGKISSALSQALKWRGVARLPGPRPRSTFVLFLAACTLGAIALWQDPALALRAGLIALSAVIAYAMARTFALSYARSVDWMRWRAVFTLAPLLLFAGALVFIIGTETLSLGPPMLSGLGLLCAALFNSALNVMRTRDTLEFNLLRKNLSAARRYFIKELGVQRPRLRDAWLPYLIAFGLGPHVDRWFRSYGATGGGAGDTLGARASGTLSTGAWSGGGGSFAGAGATGSWTAAVGGIAAGVAAPSSGGSGNGGGGGGSGGGGGGGW